MDKTARPPEPPKKTDVGTVAAIGVAISGAITALTLILGYVFGLVWWQYPLLLLGLMLVISSPSMLIAWLKLRQRTLGPILEANGWAINGRVRINVPFGTKLTERAKKPVHSTLDRNDPYEDKEANARRRRLAILLVLLVITAALVWHHHHYGHWLWADADTRAQVEAERAAKAEAAAAEATLTETPPPAAAPAP